MIENSLIKLLLSDKLITLVSTEIKKIDKIFIWWYTYTLFQEQGPFENIFPSKFINLSTPFSFTGCYISETALQRCFLEKVLWKYAAIHMGTTMPKCDFNKVTVQLYWNHTSAWVLSCKFAAYFQNTLLWEQL